MTNIRIFLSENFHFLEVKFSKYLNRRVFVMVTDILIKIKTFVSETLQGVLQKVP